MKNKWMVTAGAAALVMGAAGVDHAQAQTTYSWPATDRDYTAAGLSYFLPMGTPLMLRTRTQVNTKQAKPGDRVYLEVAETVSFRGQVVIPIGAPAMGEVSYVQRNGHFGRKGKLEIRLLQVETPSGPARLTGVAYDEGKSGTVASVATMGFVSVLGGALIHGTSGEIRPGAPVQAYLADPLRFYWRPVANPGPYAAQQAIPDAYVPSRPVFSPEGTYQGQR